LLADETVVSPALLARFVQQPPADANASAAAGVVAGEAPTLPAGRPAALVRGYAPASSHSAQDLQAALLAHAGNQSRAAQSLGLTLRQFSYRLLKSSPR